MFWILGCRYAFLDSLGKQEGGAPKIPAGRVDGYGDIVAFEGKYSVETFPGLMKVLNGIFREAPRWGRRRAMHQVDTLKPWPRSLRLPRLQRALDAGLRIMLMLGEHSVEKSPVFVKVLKDMGRGGAYLAWGLPCVIFSIGDAHCLGHPLPYGFRLLQCVSQTPVTVQGMPRGIAVARLACQRRCMVTLPHSAAQTTAVVGGLSLPRPCSSWCSRTLMVSSLTAPAPPHWASAEVRTQATLAALPKLHLHVLGREGA